MFQHRHYKAIAKAIADERASPVAIGFTKGQQTKVLNKLEARLIALFESDNYNFDRDRFLKASHLKPDMHGKDKVR